VRGFGERIGEWEGMQEEQPEKFGYWKKKRDTTNCNNHSNDYII